MNGKLRALGGRVNLKYSLVCGRLAVCRLPPESLSPALDSTGPFLCLTRTSDELSIVCMEEHVAEGAKAETGWVCFKLHGPFPFNQTGVLAGFINPLAEYRIPIFAISTFDTDYVLVKEEFLGMAMQALAAAGHELQ